MRTPEQGHTKRCLAQAMICAVENARDDTIINDFEFRLWAQGNTALTWADIYLAEGTATCVCPPLPTTRRVATLTWVCTCCLLKLANDDTSGCEDSCTSPEDHPSRWLENYPDDADLTIGMLIAEHDDACPARTDPGLECFGCEEREFSRTVCAGCGTHLAGSRHAVTMWTET